MRIRFHQLGLAMGIALAAAPLASAQPLYNPIAASPFARPALSPYLKLTPGTAASEYYMGTLRELDIRNQVLRPIVVGGSPDILSGYGSPYAQGFQSVTGYQSTDEWVNQRLRETQLTPSGHPTGFLMAYPYFQLPNQHSFIPYNPRLGQGQQQQQQQQRQYR